MSFFARKRQKTAMAKKKWEVESDDSGDDDSGEEKNYLEDVEAPQEMVCKKCDGERDADAFCLVCKLYFCLECFANEHKWEGKSPDDLKNKEGKAFHKIRPLVGSRSLSKLEVGWIVEDEKSQVEKMLEQERIKAEEAAKEKARKEAEEKERKEAEERKQAELEASRKAVADAAAKAIAAASAPPSAPTAPLPVPQSSKRHLFVSNIPFSCKISDVRNLFRACGRIVDLTMPKPSAPRKRPHPGSGMMQQNLGPHRGMAFIEFDSEAGAEAALKLNGHLIHHRPIRVALDVLGATRNQQRPAGTPYKTKMCMYFQQGKCFKGDKCSFAHHPREIQKGKFIVKVPDPNGSVDGGFKW
ncbi:hypothetical protein AAMO2058_001434700 [Amorphochlora amoebiformis]|eukprot:1393402-Amorphochlora_amoeboformis.AAC.2